MSGCVESFLIVQNEKSQPARPYPRYLAQSFITDHLSFTAMHFTECIVSPFEKKYIPTSVPLIKQTVCSGHFHGRQVWETGR